MSCGCYWQARFGLDCLVLTIRASGDGWLEQSVKQQRCGRQGDELSDVPSEEVFWMHGYSTEQDCIYVTTQFMSKEMLNRISDEVGPNRSLLICCTAFRCDPSQFPNLTLKKIPNAVLTRCEWGKDDYSLAVANLPPKPVEPGTQPSLFEEVES